MLLYVALYGLKGLPGFFTKPMSTFFKTLMQQGFALVHIDDILLLSNSKEDMYQHIEQIHIVSKKTIFNLLLKNHFLCFLKSNFLAMKLVTIQSNPYLPKLQLFRKFLLQLEKPAFLSIIGALIFYTKFIDLKIQSIFKPFHDLLFENTPWNGTEEHKRPFPTLKSSLTS